MKTNPCPYDSTINCHDIDDCEFCPVYMTPRFTNKPNWGVWVMYIAFGIAVLVCIILALIGAIK
jgi:hypothetical protein